MITDQVLLSEARGLFDDDYRPGGSDVEPEYTRAVIELVGRVLGKTSDDHDEVVALIWPQVSTELDSKIDAVIAAQHGDSNDMEIDAYRDALSEALTQLNHPRASEI